MIVITSEGEIKLLGHIKKKRAVCVTTYLLNILHFITIICFNIISIHGI